MPKPGVQSGGVLGPDVSLLGLVNQGSVVAYAMASLNTGWAARFTAETTDDITAFRQNWSSVNTPGTVRYRLETIDATTGKPSGTLYDANATIDVTPAAGIQLYTFATPPTTGLVVGDEYAMVALTTVAGTTQTLSSSTSATASCKYPAVVLTAADGTTRSNFAEVGGSMPVINLVDEGSVERYAQQFLPFLSVTNNPVFGASTWVACRAVIDFPVKVAGIRFIQQKAGTAAGDLRIRVFTDAGVLVAGTTVSIDKDSLLTGSNNRPHTKTFVAALTLSPGTYRIVFDSAASANSSNCFRPCSCPFLSATDVGSNYRLSTSTDGGVTWTNSTTDQMCAWFLVDSLAGKKNIIHRRHKHRGLR